MTEPITLTESSRFVALEKTIAKGQQTFVEVGIALAEIRDSKLYRADYGTFEEYCKDKWGWSKQHAYNLIQCAPIVESNPQITSLNQARAIAKAPAESRAAILEAVASTGPVTAKSIEAEIVAQAPPSLESQMAEQFKGLEIPPVEPPVTQFYCALEVFTKDALDRATIKQLNSMGVYAAMIPKLIKQEIARRSK